MARIDADIESVGEPPRARSALPAGPVRLGGARTDGAPAGNGAIQSPFRVRRVRKDRTRRTVAAKPSYERRYRQTIRKVDLWSVLKMAICFYVMALVVVLFAGVVLWWIASAFGIISDIENFVGDLVNSEDFEFLSWNVLRASALVGLVIVCLTVVWTVLAAAFYNLFSQVLGGIEVTVVEDESVGRT